MKPGIRYPIRQVAAVVAILPRAMQRRHLPDRNENLITSSALSPPPMITSLLHARRYHWHRFKYVAVRTWLAQFVLVNLYVPFL